MYLTRLGKWGLGWSGFGLAFCVISSLITDFDLITKTSCSNPYNFLPSLSSAIGKLTPQRYFWRICTYFATGVRLLFGLCYYFWFLSVDVRRFNLIYKILVHIMFLCYVFEISTLLGLSAISIIDVGMKHEQLFKGFLGNAQLYMLFSIVTIFWTHRSGAFTPNKVERRLLYSRVVFFAINAYCAREAWVFFNLYSAYCDRYGYVKFVTCEYVIATTNMLFHGIGIIDFQRYSFAVIPTHTVPGDLPDVTDIEMGTKQRRNKSIL